MRRLPTVRDIDKLVGTFLKLSQNISTSFWAIGNAKFGLGFSGFSQAENDDARRHCVGSVRFFLELRSQSTNGAHIICA